MNVQSDILKLMRCLKRNAITFMTVINNTADSEWNKLCTLLCM